MKYLYGTIAIILLVGCNQPEKINNNRYSLDECREEIINGKDFSKNNSIDKIVVIKKERKMYLYKDNKVQNTLPISLGKNPIGTKIQQGDNRTPEGKFWLSRKLCSPKYYRSLCISYPRPSDIARATKRGVSPGGSITIHAQPTWNANGKGDKYTLTKDWTRGCVAITNDAMKDLWHAVRVGVPIIII